MVTITIEIDDKFVRGILEDVVEEILEDEAWVSEIAGRKLKGLEKERAIAEIVNELMEDEDLIEEIFKNLIEDYIEDIGPAEIGLSDKYEEILEKVEKYLEKNFQELTV